MNKTIHFDPRAVRPVTGGVVVSFDSTHVPGRAEVIETASVVTITLFDERPTKRQRFGRFSHREVFVPLVNSVGLREVIDGSYAPAPQYLLAS